MPPALPGWCGGPSAATSSTRAPPRRSFRPSWSAAGTVADTQRRAASSASSGLATSASPPPRSFVWGTVRGSTRRWTGRWRRGREPGACRRRSFPAPGRPTSGTTASTRCRSSCVPFGQRRRANASSRGMPTCWAPRSGASRSRSSIRRPASFGRTGASPPTATRSPPAATRTRTRWSRSSSASSSRRAGSRCRSHRGRPVASWTRSGAVTGFGEGPRGTPGHDLVTGDGNIVPFWLGVVPDDLGAVRCSRAVTAAGLTEPAAAPLQRCPSLRRGRASSASSCRTTRGRRSGRRWGRWPPKSPSASTRSVAGAGCAATSRSSSATARCGRSSTGRCGRTGAGLGLWRADEAMLWGALFLDLLRRSPRPAAPR